MSPANSEFYHRNITIKNSKFTNTGGSGIVLARCKDILVENNHFNGTGSGEDSRMWNRGSGLWTYTCNDALIQENILRMLTDHRIHMALILTGDVKGW